MRLGSVVITRAGFFWSSTFLTAAVTLFFALRSGQDVNWDQLNYHLSSPFLLLHGTFWRSIAPSGLQTYLNPLVLLPQYIMLRSLPPMAATIVIDLVQCLAFVIAARICLGVAGPDLDGTGYRHALLGFVLCLASPMALSEAGTTIVDLLLATPVLLAYYLLLQRETASASRRSCVVAGILLGVAAGLKLTNAPFAIGAPLFLLAGTASPRQRAIDLVQLVLGGMAGFVVVAGYWHFELWRHFGSPTFPYFNDIFHSPDAPAVSLRDSRFVTTSAWDVVRYPVYWLFGGSPTPGLLSPASETDPKDARFVLILLVAPAALAVHACRRDQPRLLARPATGLLLAWALDYLVWLYLFGIHRYMIPIEILSGAVLLVLVSWIDTGRLRFWVLLAMAAVVLVRIHVASWQHLPWAAHSRVVATAPLRLQGAPIIFLSSKPTAFVALSLPDTARYVGMYGDFDLAATNDTTLTRQLKRDLAAADGISLYAVVLGTLPGVTARELASYGLRVSDDCQTLAAGGKTFRVCTVVR